MAAAIKTPLPTLGVIILALWSAVGRRTDPPQDSLRPWSLAALTLFVIVYLWTALTGHINLGLRHLIPAQMAVFILCGSAGVLMRDGRRAVRGAVPALLVCLAGTSLLAWPDYIPYFNALAGGSPNGWKYLADSNVDWGQDLPRLARYLREHGEQDVKLAYFGSGRPEYYGIRASYFTIPYEAASLDGGPPGPPADFTPGTYAISATALQGWNLSIPLYYWDESLNAVPAELEQQIEQARRAGVAPDDPELSTALRRRGLMRYAQLLAGLRAREPDHVIGHSILIYRLTQADLNALLSLSQPPAGHLRSSSP